MDRHINRHLATQHQITQQTVTLSLTYSRQEGFSDSHHSKLVYINLFYILIHCYELSITRKIHCSIVDETP